MTPPPDPSVTEWVPVWNPVAVGPVGPTGPAGTAIAVAKYWLVEPFAGLPFASALNGLGNGYVKSIVGEPLVVATIPLTDTSGILPDGQLSSNVALKNIDNNFVAQTLADNTTIRGNNSLLGFYSNFGGPDQKRWRAIQYGDGALNIEAHNDAATLLQTAFIFGRNGVFTSHVFSAIEEYFGPGMRFPPAVQNRSTSPNTLDDYQEQFFQPILSGDSGSGVNYSSRNGIAIKIGGMVFVSGGFSLSNKGSLGGQIYLSGFPWSCSDKGNSSLTVNYFGGLLTPVAQLSVSMIPGTARGGFYYIPANGGTSFNPLNGVNIGNNMNIQFSFSYPSLGV